MKRHLRSCSLLLLLCILATAVSETAQQDVDSSHEEAKEEHSTHAHYAVLFPFFSLTIGVIAFWVLARYAPALPFTAVMFLIGTIMGICVELHDETDDLSQSIRLWIPIDGEVLLLVFLPGLVYKDAWAQNVNLFRLSFGQSFFFAFPLVLAGTVLTALVAYYLFPYGWSFNLAMTFGAILSATDTVAVCLLLEQVGAPPRLKAHISGEALMNDGSAIVFFSIFLKKYLTELDVPGLGEDIDWGTGIAQFFRKSLGGVAVGIFFGICIVICLHAFRHHCNREENVVEVVATFALAYVGYYCAEAAWKVSGILCNVACGLTVKLLGTGVINDPKLYKDFWTLVEHILNTVFFTLGGTIWGAVLASGEQQGLFGSRDWGYLVLLYVMLLLIRAAIFAGSYPITSRIGLSTCWEEQVFQVWGGLRGTVGITLALVLDSIVTKEAEDFEFVRQTRMVFTMVGGVAFMTLTINGITAKPLLQKLRLAESTETRKKIVHTYQARIKSHAIDTFVRLMTQSRFRGVNFALVKHHIPMLADMTRDQLRRAIKKHKDRIPADKYQPPYLTRVLPYLKEDDGSQTCFLATSSKTMPDELGSANGSGNIDDVGFSDRSFLRANRLRRRKRSHSNLRLLMTERDTLSLQELRILFISLLKASYEKQKHHGELAHLQYLAVALEQSLELAAQDVSHGKPLADWDYTQIADTPIAVLIGWLKKAPVLKHVLKRYKEKLSYIKFSIKRLNVERAISFIAAHEYAQAFIEGEFLDSGDEELAESCKRVVAESNLQCQHAECILDTYSREIVSNIVSHKFCIIILTLAIHNVEKLVQDGLLNEIEAEGLIEQFAHDVKHVRSCREKEHPGEMEVTDSEHDSAHDSECGTP